MSPRFNSLATPHLVEYTSHALAYMFCWTKMYNDLLLGILILMIYLVIYFIVKVKPTTRVEQKLF